MQRALTGILPAPLSPEKTQQLLSMPKPIAQQQPIPAQPSTTIESDMLKRAGFPEDFARILEQRRAGSR